MNPRAVLMWSRAVGVAFLLLAASGIAVAAPEGKARDHYARAIAFARVEDRRGAIREFEESFKWSAEPNILYNIALTYRELGEGAPGGTPQDLMLAVEYYERYLAASPRAKERAKIRAWIATVRSTVAEQSAAPAGKGKASDGVALAPTAPAPTEERAPSTVPPPAAPAALRQEQAAPPVAAASPLPPGEPAPPVPLPGPEAQSHAAEEAAASTGPHYRLLEGILGSTIAVSLAGVATGVGMLYWDHRVPCTPLPPATECPVVHHYDTRSSGIALIAGGGAIAAGTAALLLYMELERRRAERPVAIAPWVGGSTFGVSALGAF